MLPLARGARRAAAALVERWRLAASRRRCGSTSSPRPAASCNLTLADRIIRGLGADELWAYGFAPYASCADAAVKLLGVPYEFWSLTLFVAVGIAAIWALTAAR